ncbi:MAG: spore cortex biosynthesis protein YabQ [Lachnospiraceae bacterium]
MAGFIVSQSASFLAFFCCGVCAAAFFDLFRMLRKLLPHSRLAVALEDIIFWTVTGICAFLLLMIFQSGRLRIFLPIAFGMGSALWMAGFSRLLLGPVCRFILFLKEKAAAFIKTLFASDN